MDIVRRKHVSKCARASRSRKASNSRISLETLESRELLSAFVSTAGTGNWSALSTWATQDGGAVTHVPGAGDTVTINGKVTVDVTTTVGTGSGDAISLNTSANMGDKTLNVAAPLTVCGSIKFLGHSVVNVQAGAGIELDASAGVQPKLHAPSYGSEVNLYFYGTADSHTYLRTKVGTAGLPGVVTPDAYQIQVNIGGNYVDITDINGGASADPGSYGPMNQWGLTVYEGTDAVMNTLGASR